MDGATTADRMDVSISRGRGHASCFTCAVEENIQGFAWYRTWITATIRYNCFLGSMSDPVHCIQGLSHARVIISEDIILLQYAIGVYFSCIL
jgi:hypothetical protein